MLQLPTNTIGTNDILGQSHWIHDPIPNRYFGHPVTNMVLATRFPFAHINELKSKTTCLLLKHQAILYKQNY